MVKYLEKLFELQKTEYNLDMTQEFRSQYRNLKNWQQDVNKTEIIYDKVPTFRVRNFISQDDLFEYTSNKKYQNETDRDGICFGFEMVQESDSQKKWKLKLYMNDQSEKWQLQRPNFKSNIDSLYKPIFDETVNYPNPYAVEW